MSTVKKQPKKDAKDFMAKMQAEAASQDKHIDIYLAEQSEGFKQILIRMHREVIKELKQIKSLGE